MPVFTHVCTAPHCVSHWLTTRWLTRVSVSKSVGPPPRRSHHSLSVSLTSDLHTYPHGQVCYIYSQSATVLATVRQRFSHCLVFVVYLFCSWLHKPIVMSPTQSCFRIINFNKCILYAFSFNIIFARLVLGAMSFIIVFGVGHWKAFRTSEGLGPDDVMLR